MALTLYVFQDLATDNSTEDHDVALDNGVWTGYVRYGWARDRYVWLGGAYYVWSSWVHELLGWPRCT